MSSFFRGGTERLTDNANYWVDNGVNVYGALVAGSTVKIDPSWQTMAQFTAPGENVLLNDSAGNRDALLSTNRRGQGYVTAGNVNRWEFNWDGELNLGNANLSTQIAGVVLYAESTFASNPANAILIAAHQSAILGQGDAVTWGGNGTNLLGHWKQVVGGSVAFRGTIENELSQAKPWTTNTWNLGFALVRDTNSFTPSGTERTMADISATWCTSADPVNSIASGVIVGLTGVERRSIYGDFGLQALEHLREKESAGGTQVRWRFTGGSGGNLVAGEVVSAVVSFLYPSTGYTAATAFPYNWDGNPNLTIQSNRNIIYGGTANARVGTTRIRLAP